MAVSANQVSKRQEPCRANIPSAASTHHYAGALAFADANGYAAAVINGGANAFAGVVVDEVNNASGANGDLDVELHTEGIFELQGSGFTQALVGDKIYASDNYTVTGTSTANTLIGRCVGYVSSTKILVKIEVGAQA